MKTLTKFLTKNFLYIWAGAIIAGLVWVLFACIIKQPQMIWLIVAGAVLYFILLAVERSRKC